MGGGKGGSARRIVDYHIDMHWGVCWGPVDSLDEIRFKEEVAWNAGVSTNTTLDINQGQLFGGNEAEGGVVGTIEVLMGGAAQTLTDVLAGYLGLTAATAPGFRGLLSLWLHAGPNNRGFMIGQNNPYIAPMDVRVTRYAAHPNLNPAHDQIVTGATTQCNPVHIIFEVYTNSDWGLGWPVAAFNLATWLQAADDIFTEGIGLGMMWMNSMEIEAFVSEVLDHIQAAVYTDPRTGLIEIKLFRADETPTKTFTVDNSTLRNMERRALEDTINEIVVSYTDPESEGEATVTLQDLANIAAQQGRIKSDGRNYYGVRDPDLAWRLGERDIREASYPLFSCDILTDKTQGPVLPGEVVELVWPEEGITSMQVRVLNINRGKKNAGQIVLSVTEDIWSLDQGTFETPPSSQWALTYPDPVNFPQISAITSPYPVLSRLGLDPAYADVFVGILAQSDDPNVETFTLDTEIVNAAGDTVDVSYTGMLETAFATLTTALPLEHTTTFTDAQMWTMDGDWDSFATGQLFYVGDSTNDSVNEIIMLQSYGAGSWTIKRGLYDTVPRAWSSGTKLWFLNQDSFASADPNSRPAGAAVSYWPRPRTINQTLAKVSTTELVYTPSERPHLPFRPANVQVDGDGGFGLIDLGTPADFTISWSNRNRTLEDTVALHWDEANATPETGQTTTVQFLNASDDSVLVTYTGLTGTSLTVPSAGGSTTAWSTKMRVWSVRDGLASLQYFERLVDVDFDFAALGGYGANYGNDYGTGA